MTKSLAPMFSLALIGGIALAACTPAEQSAAVGAVGGAVLGAAVSGDGDRDKGALVGGMLGAAAGAMIGQANQPGQCYYHDGNGGRYIAPC